MHDVQTLAMLSCIFQLRCQQYNQADSSSSSPLLNAPHSPATPLRAGSGTHLSSSWQDIGSGFTQVGTVTTTAAGVSTEDEERAQEERTHRLNCQLLDVSLIRQGDEYRRCYANILYQWQLLEQRAEVVKLQSKRSEDQTEIGQ